jgi:hypothetical protein
MKLAALAVPLLLLACAEPVTVTRVVDNRPRVLLQGAPQGAVLILDGKLVGEASAYAGAPGVLLLEPGTHILEVRLGDALLLSQKVFLGGGELKTLVVAAPGVK